MSALRSMRLLYFISPTSLVAIEENNLTTITVLLPVLKFRLTSKFDDTLSDIAILVSASVDTSTHAIPLVLTAFAVKIYYVLASTFTLY